MFPIDEPPIAPDDTQDALAITQAMLPVDDHVADAGEMVMADVLPNGVWFESEPDVWVFYLKTDARAAGGLVSLYALTGWGRGEAVTVTIARGW